MTEWAAFCPGCGDALPLAHAPDEAGAAGPGAIEVPWNVGHVTAALFLLLAVLFVAAFSARAIGPLYPRYEAALETWVAVHLLALGMALVVWFLGLRSSSSPMRTLGFVRPRESLGMSALLALVALCFSIGATFVYGLVIDQLELDALRPPEIDVGVLFPGAGILLTLQALALVTPITEEVVFRGFVLRGLLNRMGAGPAVVSTALVFSALHLDTGTLVPIFLTGLALGWLHVRTGSLWPCIAVHAGQNLLALLAVRAGLTSL